jgi:biopolymer transport protein ExbD
MADHKYKSCLKSITRFGAIAVLLASGVALVSTRANAQQKAASGVDWKPVQEVFGFAGDMLPENVIRFNMPRKDLHVTVGGTEVKPGLALGAWAAFHRVGNNDAMIMGDLVLTDDEVTPVMKALQEGGVEVTALHNHLLGESPRILYIHMGGHGDPVKLAQAVKNAVALTKTPMPPGAGANESQELGFDVAAVNKIMGSHGKVSGGVLHFNVPRAEMLTEEGMNTPPSMGAGTSINFQPTDIGRAAIAGDFAMTGKEVGPVMKVLQENGIEAVALHSHALDDVPRLFYMHFWANDDAVKLAKGLRAALDKTNSKK